MSLLTLLTNLHNIVTDIMVRFVNGPILKVHEFGMSNIIIILLLPFSVIICKEYKMVLVVNSQPQLSIGKTASQVAHGAVSLFGKMLTKNNLRNDVNLWLKKGQTKVVLRAVNPDQMLLLKKKAKKFKLQSCLIHDAGRTEVESGTLTVLALFGEESNMNKVTSNLPLLK